MVSDQWTFVAIDPDTKLIPAYRVGRIPQSLSLGSGG
jgi:hypothetical protein